MSQPFRDRQGREIDVIQWMTLHHDQDYHNVATTYVGKVGRVSTVWMGVDPDDGRDPPLIFETMIFPQHPAMLNLAWRYPTEQEARHGHYKACAYLRVYMGQDGQTPKG